VFTFIIVYRIIQDSNEIDTKSFRLLFSDQVKWIVEDLNSAHDWLTSKYWNEIKAFKSFQDFQNLTTVY
jgi:ERCC4-type nuclease